MLKITKLKEKEPVYDIEVKDNHNFFANGLCAHNCEISVPSHSLDNFNNQKGEIGCCILSNLNLGYTKESDIPKVADFLVRFLDNLIDISDYVMPEVQHAAEKRRTLGIGISNLFGYLAKSKQFYNTKSARENISTLVETFYYHLIKTSIELAKERGKCELFVESFYSNNKFIFERYRESGVKFEFKPKLDWEPLRAELSKYGMRHSSLCAVPPAGNCISETMRIRTSEGDLSLKDICERESLDIDELVPGWYDLKEPIELQTKDGHSQSRRFFYNGIAETIEIETELGTINVTLNHELLVERGSNQVWITASQLTLDDVICAIE